MPNFTAATSAAEAAIKTGDESQRGSAAPPKIGLLQNHID
jgi:hypothetical protein